jgi:hypothetical protein
VVACPALREWPAYLLASSPVRSASFFTILATSMPASATLSDGRADQWTEDRPLNDRGHL